MEAKLALRWSPEQIAGWLPLAYPQDSVMRVSHETIDLSLFVQSRGALRRELQRLWGAQTRTRAVSWGFGTQGLVRWRFCSHC